MAKDFIARFANQLAELYSKLLPTPCLLCGVDVADKVLCPACIKALPKIGQACQRCAYPIESAGICGHCLHSPPAQDRSFSAFIYQTTASRLISKFKYQQQLCLTDFFAEQIATVRQTTVLPQLLIPIPLHPSRLKHRGYNQSFELAKSLSKRLQIPTHNCLTRIRATQSQAELPFKQREKNVKNAFSLTSEIKLPSHVAIIDDVLTSGHTANEVTKLVKNNGVDMVEVWTIARTIRHDGSQLMLVK